MNKKTKLLVGGAGIAVLLVVLGTTTIGATAEFVTPTDLAATEEHDGDLVKLEGRVADLEDGSEITFRVADANESYPVVYGGEMPETMAEGRVVVAKGRFDGERVDANDLTVRAHEGTHPEGIPRGEGPAGSTGTDSTTTDTATAES
jgi:cytochrome c-type biogenesis protein CcmE